MLGSAGPHDITCTSEFIEDIVHYESNYELYRYLALCVWFCLKSACRSTGHCMNSTQVVQLRLSQAMVWRPWWSNRGRNSLTSVLTDSIVVNWVEELPPQVRYKTVLEYYLRVIRRKITRTGSVKQTVRCVLCSHASRRCCPLGHSWMGSVSVFDQN